MLKNQIKISSSPYIIFGVKNLRCIFWRTFSGESRMAKSRNFCVKMFHEKGFCKTGSFLALLQHSREKAARN
jgi:hypothetical protein